MLLLPERYRIACVGNLGLTARQVIVWAKPNSLPESVTDRVRRSHEDWVHLTCGPCYYAAVDEICEPHVRGWGGAPNGGHTYTAMRPAGAKDTNLADCDPNPLGALPGSVWQIPSQPLRVPAALGVDHFAAFPTEWPRRLILGWSPAGICTACGRGRTPVRADTYVKVWNHQPQRTVANPDNNLGSFSAKGRGHVRRHLTGDACDCPSPTAPTRPAVVCDPFGGTGTTALVASALGRIGISVDRSADYGRLARWRTGDPAQRARAAGLGRLPVLQCAGQNDLLAALAELDEAEPAAAWSPPPLQAKES